jgi:hypothetical protein
MFSLPFYQSITVIMDDMKKNAISYGDSSYILQNTSNINNIDKVYSGTIDIYGDRKIQSRQYPIGFLNEVKMYKVAKADNYPFVPQYVTSNEFQLTITIQHLYDYISLNDYISRYYENCNITIFYHSLFKLLDMMKEKSFVHGNISIQKIMICPKTMDMKVIDLKHSFISSESQKPHIFTHERNHILYDIFRKLHPQFSSLVFDYFKYRNPTYYTSNRPSYIGKFFDITVSNLFDEKDDETNVMDNRFVDFIHTFIHFRDNALNINPFHM